MLQLVPVLSMLFLITSPTGSALFAIELENSASQSTMMLPEPEEEDLPPPYEDEPLAPV
jgi:hypothetical protein